MRRHVGDRFRSSIFSRTILNNLPRPLVVAETNDALSSQAEPRESLFASSMPDRI